MGVLAGDLEHLHHRSDQIRPHGVRVAAHISGRIRETAPDPVPTVHQQGVGRFLRLAIHGPFHALDRLVGPQRIHRNHDLDVRGHVGVADDQGEDGIRSQVRSQRASENQVNHPVRTDLAVVLQQDTEGGRGATGVDAHRVGAVGHHENTACQATPGVQDQIGQGDGIRHRIQQDGKIRTTGHVLDHQRIASEGKVRPGVALADQDAFAVMRFVGGDHRRIPETSPRKHHVLVGPVAAIVENGHFHRGRTTHGREREVALQPIVLACDGRSPDGLRGSDDPDHREPVELQHHPHQGVFFADHHQAVAETGHGWRIHVHQPDGHRGGIQQLNVVDQVGLQLEAHLQGIGEDAVAHRSQPEGVQGIEGGKARHRIAHPEGPAQEGGGEGGIHLHRDVRGYGRAPGQAHHHGYACGVIFGNHRIPAGEARIDFVLVRDDPGGFPSAGIGQKPGGVQRGNSHPNASGWSICRDSQRGNGQRIDLRTGA